MRIGVLAPPWVAVPPVGYGGTENVVDELCVALQAAGHEIHLAAARDSTCPVPRIGGTALADVDRIGMDLPLIRHVVHAYDEFHRLGVDVVHDHTTLGPLYRHRDPRIPAVTTAHGAFDEESLEIFAAIARDVPVVAISRRQAETATGVPIDRVIHHGIDATAIPVGRGGDYAVFLGRMDPTKGILDAIRIARRTGIPLRIAAKIRSTIEHSYFDDVVRAELGPDDDFMGEIDRDAKFELLGGALMLIDPLHWEEPFGMVMIESLATGTPVAVGRRGSAPEIVDHGTTGFLCDNDDDFVAALEGAVRLDRRACRAVVESRFSSARMAGEYAALYADVIALARAGT